MDQPSTSQTMGNSEINSRNIGSMTTKTLERILWKLKLDQTSNNSIPLSEPIARTARYTGMKRVNIEKLLAFGDTLKFNDVEDVEIDRQIIRRCLTDMCIFMQRIPTITELFHELGDRLPIYVDLDYFIKILIRMGYVFYKFPGSNVLRVMEKKTVMFDRYRYLKSIQQYRQQKVPIVYVGFASVTNQMKILNLEKTLQTDPKNISRHILFTATANEICNVKPIFVSTYEVLQDVVKKWLLSIFNLQNLPPGSVCVLEDSKIFNETLIDVPTWKSVKADMVEWLEEHNIPCHIDMPKADLLHLIETCTDTKKNTFVIDNLVKTHNYVILRLPQCINGLSLVPFVIRFLNDKLQKKDLANIDYGKLFENVFAVFLKPFSNTIEEEELQQLIDDKKIDEVLDDLVRNIKYLDVEDNEDDTTLFTYSDSE